MRLSEKRAGKLSRRRGPSHKRLIFDDLEGRVLMTARIWSGNSPVNALWSDARNWVGNQLPVAGDDLQFPAGANRLASTNDLAFSAIKSLTFSFGGSGFVLGGNAIDIGTGGISDSSASSSNTINLGLRLPGGFPQSTTSVVNSGVLRLGGSISTTRVGGSSNLVKLGGGDLIMAGTAANSYRGTTTIVAGQLTLSKSGPTAIPGALIVGDGANAARVVLTSDDQIADASAVILNVGSTLDLNNQAEMFGSLTITGASVLTGGGIAGMGLLTLNGDVLVKTSSTIATMTGNFSLGTASRNYTVEAGATLNVFGNTRSGLLGVGFNKQGEGVMRIGGDNTLLLGIVKVNEGTLILQAGSGQKSIVAPIVVGDGIGQDLLINGSPGQLGSGGTVNINSSGVYDVGAGETLPGLTMNGGRLTLSASSGGFIRFSGNITATSDSLGNPAVIDGTGQVDMTGTSGPQQLSATVNDGPGDIDFSIKSNLLRRTANFDATFRKFGAGTLELAGTNTITDMFLNAGRLLVNGVQSSTFTRAVNAGVILGGRGQMGRVQIDRGAIYSPGSPDSGPGILTSANLDFSAPAEVYRVQLNGILPGTQYDQARASGTVNMNSSPTLDLSLNFQPTTGTTFTIIENLSTAVNSTTGSFQGLPEGSHLSVGGWDFTITYQGGFDQNDVILTYNGVRALNQAPTLARISRKQVTEGETLEFTVTAADVNNDLLSYRLAPGAPKGATIDPKTGTFRWTPNRGSARNYRVTIEVLDNGPAHATGKITVHIIVRRARFARLNV